jgi:hypothetical protein
VLRSAKKKGAKRGERVQAVGRDGQLGTQLAHFTAPARELGVTTNDCSLPLEYDTWEAQDGGPPPCRLTPSRKSNLKPCAIITHLDGGIQGAPQLEVDIPAARPRRQQHNRGRVEAIVTRLQQHLLWDGSGSGRHGTRARVTVMLRGTPKPQHGHGLPLGSH